MRQRGLAGSDLPDGSRFLYEVRKRLTLFTMPEVAGVVMGGGSLSPTCTSKVGCWLADGTVDAWKVSFFAVGFLFVVCNCIICEGHLVVKLFVRASSFGKRGLSA